MPINASFLWLDVTGWTAIGTLVALGIALGLTDWIRTLIRRPSLTLDYRRSNEFCTTTNAFWLRVPIKNKKGRRFAENVEVFLERATKVNQQETVDIDGFIPMRLKWCHTEAPICPMIPPDSFRLINIGYVEIAPQVQIVGDIFNIDFPSFVFAGEVATDAHAPLARGMFELTFSITARDIPKQILKARVTIRPANEVNGPLAKIEAA